jgi:peptide-methionine (S)-S-oxide reductase
LFDTNFNRIEPGQIEGCFEIMNWFGAWLVVASFGTSWVQNQHTDFRSLTLQTQGSQPMEIITLGAGCFWCVEAIFDQIPGVSDVVSGYSGGHIKNPAYREVCTGRTGHAEVVQVTFDPQVVSLDVLLDVFFVTHDPTTLNRQGADVGTQYRSAVFVRNEKQREIAEAALIRNQEAWSDPIVTEITDFSAFYMAEDVHQSYYELHGEAPYCKAVIAPKVAKFHKTFGAAFGLE